jgi:hypothetical protein
MSIFKDRMDRIIMVGIVLILIVANIHKYNS